MCWVCDDCGEKFDEPDYIEEPAEYDNGISGSWKTACCPYCGSEEIDRYHEEGEEDGED